MDVENEATSGSDTDRKSVATVESYLDASDRDKVQRKLRQRHVQMCVTILLPFCSLVLTLGKDRRKKAVVLGPLTILTKRHSIDRWNSWYWPFPCTFRSSTTWHQKCFLTLLRDQQGSGLALRRAGPLGALIAYSLVGTVAYS